MGGNETSRCRCLRLLRFTLTVRLTAEITSPVIVSTTYDFCILGAGLAGLALADSLLQRNQTVLVIDKAQPGAGASGTPGGMVNPATGRRAKLIWRAEKCYEGILKNLRRASAYAHEPFFHKTGVLRPALTSKMARKMREQFGHTNWPEGWARWMQEDEIKRFHPGVSCVDGGIWLPVGLTVDVAAYLRAFVRLLDEAGATIIPEARYEIKTRDGDWKITIDENLFRARHMVAAAGSSTPSITPWEKLPIHPLKGQVLGFQVDEPINFEHSLSGLGYLARVSEHKFVMGSTYEHHFTDDKPDDEGRRRLLDKLQKLLPELAIWARPGAQWAGIRASTPDRQPFIGTHPETTHAHVFTGLGSKGLLYSQYLAELLSEWILEGKDLPARMNVQRLDLY